MELVGIKRYLGRLPPPMPNISPKPLIMLKTGSDKFSAVSPSEPIPREIKKVSIRIYTDTPKELITFANMYLKKSSRIGFLSII